METAKQSKFKLKYPAIVLMATLALFFALGMLTQRLMYVAGGTTVTGIKEMREESFAGDKYKYINPLLGCELENGGRGAQFTALKAKISGLIQTKINGGEAANISVYFDNRDGRWLGINTAEKYFPASLMKVPTMIALYKEAESNPEILKKKITFNGDYDLNQLEYLKPAEGIQPHQSYTIEELIRRMIVYSDNNTLPLLISNIDDAKLQEVYADLGIVMPENTQDTLADYMTIKEYVSFFRVLFNASYLNRGSSERALGLLSGADFPQGIMAGVPRGMTVAQKFGERNFSATANNDAQTSKELHDCGIIYYPNHPYMLCVMTKGNNFDLLTKSIRDISKLVYDNVDAKFKSKP